MYSLLVYVQTSDAAVGVGQPAVDPPAEGVVAEPVFKGGTRPRLSSVGSNESNGSRRSSRSRKSSSDSGSVRSGSNLVRKRKKVSNTHCMHSYQHAGTSQLPTSIGWVVNRCMYVRLTLLLLHLCASFASLTALVSRPDWALTVILTAWKMTLTTNDMIYYET